MASDTRIFIAKKNIEHYKKLLAVVFDPSASRVIEQLLREAEAELGAAEAEESPAATRTPIYPDQVRRWRLKAEEYRATADISQNEAARDHYLRLAMTYEQLADGAERKPDADKIALKKIG